jgi:TRAP-type C4-dicarboxylate transport system substrate-binding protein
VYPINIFSQSRLDALPPDRQQALRKAMQAYGSSNTQDGRTHWILSGEEEAAARSDLQAHAMLGSLIDPRNR